MYKKLSILTALFSIILALSAFSPVDFSPPGLNVACGDVVPANARVRSVQGPDLHNPKCIPVETKTTIDPSYPLPDVSFLHEPRKTAQVVEKTGFSILTVPNPAAGGFIYNHYYSGTQHLKASVSTNRSFTLTNTGYQRVWFVLFPEDAQCATMLKDHAYGYSTPFFTVYDACTSTYLYTASMNSTWATDYERTDSFWGVPVYTEAMLETSSACYRAALYNYTTGVWEYKGVADCNPNPSFSGNGVVEHQMFTNPTGTYTTYANGDFTVSNIQEWNQSTNNWGVIPMANMSIVRSDPPFNSNPYHFNYGIYNTNYNYMQSWLHTP